jgi:glycosyltransferase involved in cell wall biosynthesis
MRIAYLLTSLGIGGAERQVIALAERMQARGHDVVLLVLRSREARQWPTKIEVIHLDMTKTPSGILKGLLRGQGSLRKFKPDVLHSHTFPANMAARMLRLLGCAPKVLSTIHNVYEGGRQRMLAYRLSDWLSVHTTAVSRIVAERYIGTGAVPRKKCSVLTNGIDTHAFSPAATLRNPRSLLGTKECFVWLAAGRTVPAKDFDNLLAAFRLVREQMPEAQVWIAGERGDSHAALESESASDSGGVRSLGLCNDMPATIAVADAFVLSSAWEGMPLVVGEAMSMEKPVVATDVGGVRELVGDAGVIVPAKNSGILANGMMRVMRMTAVERGAMGKMARRRIIEHFDMELKSEEWEALYGRLLQTSGDAMVGLSADLQTGTDGE